LRGIRICCEDSKGTAHAGTPSAGSVEDERLPDVARVAELDRGKRQRKEQTDGGRCRKTRCESSSAVEATEEKTAAERNGDEADIERREDDGHIVREDVPTRTGTLMSRTVRNRPIPERDCFEQGEAECPKSEADSSRQDRCTEHISRNPATKRSSDDERDDEEHRSASQGSEEQTVETLLEEERLKGGRHAASIVRSGEAAERCASGPQIAGNFVQVVLDR
jgi:hypothetical protein